jgi:D-ribose pyranase
MLINGILNPQINSLLARVRHTNMLVIADRGFPFWPMIETVDISLVDGIPTVLQVFQAVKPNFEISQVYMAEEFVKANSLETRRNFTELITPIPLQYLPHIELKKLVPGTCGLIRTADVTQFSNMIIVSGPVGQNIT